MLLLIRWIPLCTTLAAVVVLVTGCAKESTGDLDLIQEAVITALDAWKSGEKADLLLTQPTPIEFHDDEWQRGARLVDYEIRKTYFDTDGAVRCAVSLTVRRRRSKQETLEITYQMNAASKIVIARDPYS